MREEEAKDILEIFAKAQKDGLRICPRCGCTLKEKLVTNAMSRQMDIYICDKCGVAEALEYMEGIRNPLSKWKFVETMEKKIKGYVEFNLLKMRFGKEDEQCQENMN